VALFFHAVEQDDGRWACRHGLQVYDTHANLEQAAEHLRALARAHRPASIYLHPLPGAVRHVEGL